MATKLVGSVELKRIHEFLSKALISSDLVDYSMLIDSKDDSESFKISLAELLSFTTGGSSLPIVKVSDIDTTAGYLSEKITVTGGVTKTIINSGGNEILELSLNDLSASDISDFDTEVSNNTAVTANTAKISSQWNNIADGISYPNNGVLIGTSIGSDLLYKLQVEGGNVAFRNPSGTDRFAFFGHLTDTQDANLAMYDNTDVQKVRINTNGDSYFNGGDVGIGTSTPDNLLTANKSVSGALGGIIEIANRAATVAGAAVELRLSPSFANNRYSAIQAINVAGDNVIDLSFITGTAGIITEKLRITGAGDANFSNTVTATDFIIA